MIYQKSSRLNIIIPEWTLQVLLKVRDKLIMCIIDSESGTCILGRDWAPCADTGRKAVVVSFDIYTQKTGMYIVVAFAKFQENGMTMLHMVYKFIHNKDSLISLLANAISDVGARTYCGYNSSTTHRD